MFSNGMFLSLVGRATGAANSQLASCQLAHHTVHVHAKTYDLKICVFACTCVSVSIHRHMHTPWTS